MIHLGFGVFLFLCLLLVWYNMVQTLGLKHYAKLSPTASHMLLDHAGLFPEKGWLHSPLDERWLFVCNDSFSVPAQWSKHDFERYLASFSFPPLFFFPSFCQGKWPLHSMRLICCLLWPGEVARGKLCWGGMFPGQTENFRPVTEISWWGNIYPWDITGSLKNSWKKLPFEIFTWWTSHFLNAGIGDGKAPFYYRTLVTAPSQRGVFPIACFPFLLCYFITLITLACIFSPHSYRKWLQLQLSCSQTDVLRGGGILWVTLRWLLRVPHSNL